MSEKKLVSFRLPEPLIMELKAKASEEGVSVTELVSRFSRQGLNLSLEERLVALEQKLIETAAADLPAITTPDSPAVTSPIAPAPTPAARLASESAATYAAAEPPAIATTDPTQLHLGQLQQRFDKLVQNFVNFAGDLQKLKTQAELSASIK